MSGHGQELGQEDGQEHKKEGVMEHVDYSELLFAVDGVCAL